MGVWGGGDVVPVEDVFAERCVPAARGDVGVWEPVGRGVGEAEEGRARILGVAGPPADLDLLGVPRVSPDVVLRGGLGGLGSIPGAVIGALIISVLNNGLQIMSIPQEWQNVILGLVILVAVYADMARKRTT